MAKAREVGYALVVKSGENDEETKFVDLDEYRFPQLYTSKKEAKELCADLIERKGAEIIPVMIVPVAG